MIQHADSLPTDGTEKPGALSASRPDRIGQVHRLKDAGKLIHRHDELECISEDRDGYGGLVGAFVGSPHPVIPRERM